MDYERTLRFSIRRRIEYGLARLLQKDFAQPRNCYILKLPDAILAKILRRLPRYMLAIISETCQRLSRVCYTIGLMSRLSHSEQLQYLECFTRNLLDKWVCHHCLSIHRFRYPDGPLKRKSGCSWDVIGEALTQLLFFPIIAYYPPRFDQFVLKYHRLLLLGNSKLHTKHSAQYDRIMTQISITLPINVSDSGQGTARHWIKPIIENDSFLILSVCEISKVEGFGRQGLIKFLGKLSVCAHQAGAWYGDTPRSLRERRSFIRQARVISEIDGGEFYETAPSIPSTVYSATPNGNGDNWMAAVNAAWEEPGKYFESGCYACPVRFGVMNSPSKITTWRQWYQGSESAAMTNEYLISYASDYGFSEKGKSF